MHPLWHLSLYSLSPFVASFLVSFVTFFPWIPCHILLCIQCDLFPGIPALSRASNVWPERKERVNFTEGFPQLCLDRLFMEASSKFSPFKLNPYSVSSQFYLWAPNLHLLFLCNFNQLWCKNLRSSKVQKLKPPHPQIWFVLHKQRLVSSLSWPSRGVHLAQTSLWSSCWWVTKEPTLYMRTWSCGTISVCWMF